MSTDSALPNTTTMPSPDLKSAQSPRLDSKSDDYIDETAYVPALIDNPDAVYSAASRPAIDYSSTRAFFQSVWQRFVSLWTRRFVLSLLAGQVVSLCITCTNVTTTELVMRNWALPTTQTFFL